MDSRLSTYKEKPPHYTTHHSLLGALRFLFLYPSPHDSISTSWFISPHLSQASFHRLAKASLGTLFSLSLL